MKRLALPLAIASLLCAGLVSASSHREAPSITKTPKLDGTDLYMFRSYEPGREDFVTFIANYQPGQNPYDGPNYYLLDSNAVYSIHIDNDGDALAEIVYEFRFTNDYKNLTVPVGGTNVAVPLSNIGPFGDLARPGASGPRNVVESYTLTSIRNGGSPALARNIGIPSGTSFLKPFDNIGDKSIPNYPQYAERHIFKVLLPGCRTPGRVFVGPRNEGFAVNLGKIFDLINLNPVGDPASDPNIIADKNVTTLALEVPIACLTNGSPIIGAWTTAARVNNQQVQIQRSRLSAPLINEVIIGLPDKDRFNSSQPSGDAQFATYVTNPTLPELIQILFPIVQAPNLFPRTDLVAAFLTGIEGLNKPANVVPSEMMRLNTSMAAKPAAQQSNLGVLGGDTSGFPNGRRPGDDVVDIELRVAMGVLLSATDAPSGQLPYNDGVTVRATDFRTRFPYLNTPLPGATND